MEGLVRLVAESLERHGLTVPPPRIDWSAWTPLDSNLCLTAPCRPGLFVIAECMLPHMVPRMVPHTVAANPSTQLVISQLAILKIGQTKDLGVEMARLCCYSSLPDRIHDRIKAGRCLVRLAAVDDDVQRASSCAALQQWFTHSLETSTDSRFPVDLAAQQIPLGQNFHAQPVLANAVDQPAPNHPAHLPSGFQTA